MLPRALLVLLLSLPLAGCASLDIHPAATGSLRAPVQTPLQLQGVLDPSLRACVRTSLHDACLAPYRDASIDALAWEGGGRIVQLQVVLVWRAASAATEELVITLSSGAGDERREHARLQGPSPLVLSLREIPLPPGQTHVLQVAPADEGLGFVSWRETAEQPFDLAGSVIAQDAVAPRPGKAPDP